MLKISKEYQEIVYTEINIRFCIIVNDHEISGNYRVSSGDFYSSQESSIEFDSPHLVYNKELFTPDEVDEICDWIEGNVTLPRF